MRLPLSACVLLFAAAPLAAQVRTTQPPMLQIYREIEKPGHFAAHEAVEARWVAHNRQHGFPISYMALSAISGPNEVWFLSAYDGFGALGKGQTWGGDNAAYSSGLAKLAQEDGDHLNSVVGMQLVAVPEASAGVYPDLAKTRVIAVSTFTLRPGADFTPLSKQFAALMQSRNTPVSYRVYRVVGGGPDGTVMIFESHPSWDALEAYDKATEQAMAGLAPADAQAMGKLYEETVSARNTRYFNVNPRMSLPPKEWATDPFWSGKP